MDFPELRVYQMAEKLADEIWTIVMEWDTFARFSIGQQLVKAADSIGANIAEGYGRGSYRDNQRFVKIARGSFKEMQHFLRRAYNRKLLSDSQVNILKPLVNNLGPSITAYLNSINPSQGTEILRESNAEWSNSTDLSDPVFPA